MSGGGLFDDLPPPKCSSMEGNTSQTNLENQGSIERCHRKRKNEYENDVSPKRKTEEKIVKKYVHAVTAFKGDRDEMQDFHVAIDQCINYPLIENESLTEKFKLVSTYQVFDGHGGRAASKYASENVFKQFFKDLSLEVDPDFGKNVSLKINDTFKIIDENFIKIAKSFIPPKKDGSTALSLFIFDNQVFVANIGDCKCAVVFKNANLNMNHDQIDVDCPSENIPTFLFKYLNIEHTPNDLGERSRIEKCGGFVKEGRVMGILEVSRSIGDINFKKTGVISLPTVTKYTIDRNDVCLIMGCDGFWNTISIDEIIDCLIAHKIDDPNANLKAICNRLSKISFENGSNDNITVLVVKPVFNNL